MQEFIVIILVLIAGFYVFRRVRKVLTVGEEDRKCSHCPADITKLKKAQQ